MNYLDPIYIESIVKPEKLLVKRFLPLFIILICTILILMGRGLYLQVAKGSQYRVSAEGNRVFLSPITAPRGVIYDSKGIQLVENIASTDLVLDPSSLPLQGDDFDILEKLPKILTTLSVEELNEALMKTREAQRVTLLAKAIDHDTMLLVEESGLSSQGVRIIASLARRYPYGESASHILGYTGAVSSEELTKNKDLLSLDITGKLGVEKVYDLRLRGKHGYSNLEVNAEGRPQKDLGKTDPLPGEDLNLTIDIEFQQFIYNIFKEKGEFTGTVIAIDPRSGAVRALVNYPSYDNNVFSQPSLRGSISNLFSDEKKPMFNRAVDGTYPPASTIKPFYTTAILQEGIITSKTTFNSTGGISVGPWRFPDWKAGGHGPTDARKAIAESVNTFFYLTIGGTDEHKGLGVEKSMEYLRKFGFGSPTGIDLPSEASGLLPSPEWKLERKKERWYIGDTYNLSIGQGDILTSPLQIATATATIANGQNWYKPHLLQNSTESKSLEFNPESINTVREGMRDTVIYGSGVRLSSLPIPLAGKTGTAQIGGENTHAWFTGFGPYEAPQIAITVLLEKAGGGESEAVPIAEEIWKWWINNRL